MLHIFNKNIDEAVRFLGQIANRLEKDKTFSDQISLREYDVENYIDVENYNKALEMLHKVSYLLKQQKEEIKRYEKQEEQEEEKRKQEEIAKSKKRK